MNKILITGGSCFSECTAIHVDTWPKHLIKLLNQHGYNNHVSCAKAAYSNAMITRTVMYEVIKALKDYDPNDILVGIMWSGINMFDYRCDDNSTLSWDKESWGARNPCSWQANPVSVVDGAPRNWVLGEIHWHLPEFSNYSKNYYSNIGSSIVSLEYVLQLQYFLKMKGISYFFTDYINNNIVKEEDQNNIEIAYLLNELDRNNYLPIESEHNWLITHSETKDEYIALHKNIKWYRHPKTHQHIEFVDKVVYPWLQQKGYL